MTLTSEDGLNKMVVNRSQSAELRRQQQQQREQQQPQPELKVEAESEPEDVVEVVIEMVANEVDPRGQNVVIGPRRFPAPVTFEDITASHLKRMSMIQWFDRAAVLADVESDFESLSLYAWDDELFWGVGS